MTGFVAVAGTAAQDVSVETLRRSASPDASGVNLLWKETGLALFSTIDLPAVIRPEAIAIGDVLGAGSASGPIFDQRRSALERVLTQYIETDHVADDASSEQHFIIWDRRRSALLGGRDRLGVRPLFYAPLCDGVIVASAARWALAAGASPRPNFKTVLAFIAGLPPDTDETYLDGVKRLMPGFQLRVRQGEILTYRSSPPLPAPTALYGGDAVQAFRDHFRRSVQRRLVRREDQLILLSGGLDSSAIAITAADLNSAKSDVTETLSLVFDKTPRWSERRFIEAVESATAIKAHWLDGGHSSPLGDFRSRLAEHGGLFDAPGLYLGRALYAAAARQGRSVLLDGHGGDEVVSYGYGLLHDDARAGRWRSLHRRLVAGRTEGDPPVSRTVLLYWLKYGVLRRPVSQAVRIWRGVKRKLGLLHEDAGVGLAVRSGAALMTERRFSPGDRSALPSFEVESHHRSVTEPGQATAMETLHAAASAVGVVPRYPFWDLELVQFCLSVPPTLKLRNGMARWILRAAIPELPEVVRWRRDKLDFTPHLILGMLRTHGEYLRAINARPAQDPLWRWVDREAARRLIGRLLRLRERAASREAQAVWRVGALALWLDELSEQGVDLGMGAATW